MLKIYNQEISQCVQELLEKDDWNFEFDEEKGVFRFSLTLDSKLNILHYYITVRESGYISYGVLPIAANDHKTEMAEFLTRANYGLNNGNFELDYRDGEIRFKCYVNCDGVLPSDQIIRDSIFAPATIVDHYADGILSVLFDLKDPENAVMDCEKETD